MAGRVFLGFLAANGVSLLGDAVRNFTLTLWIFDVSGQSGPAIAALGIAQMLPAALCGVVAGALVDRWPVRRVLVASDISRAIAALALVLCLATGGLALGLALVVISSFVGTFSSIAAMAAIPRLVEDSQLERANGSWSVMEQLSFVIGPAVAALAYSRWGASPAFAFDAVTFVASALLLMSFVPARLLLAPADPGRGVLSDAVEGVRYAGRNSLVRATVWALALRTLSAGINNTVMIFFVTQSLHRKSEDLAWLGVTNGMVQVAVGGLLIALSTKAPLPRTLRVGALMMMVGGVVVAAAPSLPVLIAGVVVTSVGNAPATIGQNVLEQRYVPTRFLARVRGLQEAVFPLAFLLSASSAGFLVSSIGARGLLIASAGLVVGSWIFIEFSVGELAP